MFEQDNRDMNCGGCGCAFNNGFDNRCCHCNRNGFNVGYSPLDHHFPTNGPLHNQRQSAFDNPPPQPPVQNITNVIINRPVHSPSSDGLSPHANALINSCLESLIHGLINTIKKR